MHRLYAVPAFLFLCIFICIFSQNSHPRTWYVKEDGSGDAPTIQAAIDSSTAGDTVLVAPDTYTLEDFIICEFKDSLSIISEAGAEATIINADGQAWFVYIGFLNHLLLSGFTITNSNSGGVGIDWSGDVTVDNCIIKHHRSSGIRIDHSYNVLIQYNLIYSNKPYGISAIDECTATIANNTIAYHDSTNSAGIRLDGLQRYDIRNNIVVNNYYGVTSIANDITYNCNNVFGNYENYYTPYVADPTGNDGNISTDPQFCGTDPEVSSNFYLQSDSPCAPNNHPEGYSCGIIGVYPVDCGETAVKHSSWGKIKSLFSK